jgi:cell division protein FtsB
VEVFALHACSGVIPSPQIAEPSLMFFKSTGFPLRPGIGSFLNDKIWVFPSKRKNAGPLNLNPGIEKDTVISMMSELEFVLDGKSFPVQLLLARQVCSALHSQSQTGQWFVQSKVTGDVLMQFVSAINGDIVEPTNENVNALSALCDELGFTSFAQRLKAFKGTPAYRLALLEQRFPELEADIAALRSKAESGITAALAELQSDMKKLRDSTEPLQSEVTRLTQGMSSLRSSAESAENDARATLGRLQSDVGILKKKAGGIDSMIVSDVPEIIASSCGKQFNLLWRGTRDGFGVGDFHSRCDRYANTLTLILDTDGNIFGGFTPVKWEPPADSLYERADPSLKSFLFTVKNPHKVPERKFALIADKKDFAVNCSPDYGPSFMDIHIADNSNANLHSYAQFFGSSYTNDTGLDDKTFFTGSEFFKVKEIEVFEIAP